MNNLTL